MGGYRNYYFIVILTGEKGGIKAGEKVQKEGGRKVAGGGYK